MTPFSKLLFEAWPYAAAFLLGFLIPRQRSRWERLGVGIVALLAVALETGTRLNGHLIVCGIVDEEYQMLGSKAIGQGGRMADQGRLQTYAAPTDPNLEVAEMSPWLDLRVPPKDVKLKVRPPSTVDAGSYPVSVTASAEGASCPLEPVWPTTRLPTLPGHVPSCREAVTATSGWTAASNQSRIILLYYRFHCLHWDCWELIHCAVPAS